ncbi:MAG: hypothetical protein V4717_16030 [Bacteroidota bacterium]
MKYIIFIILVISSATKSLGQCSSFLGGEKTVIPCSNPISIDYDDLFSLQGQNATYQSTSLPPSDTIPGNPAVIINYKAKYEVTATLPNGCSETTIVRVTLILDPLPNLGPDQTIKICQGETKDISNLYSTFGYQSASWNTPDPTKVKEGVYTLTVTTWFGCSDQAVVTVSTLNKPNVGADKTFTPPAGQTINLTSQFITTGLTVNWGTSTPTVAGPGLYDIVATNSDGCTDTVIATICKTPALGADKTVGVCAGQTYDLIPVFNLSGLKATWNIATPCCASPGTYQVTVTDALIGCIATDIANVTVNILAKPNIGIDLEESICENETLSIIPYFNTSGLTTNWSIANPQNAAPGIHRLIVTNNSGCKDTAYITLTAFPHSSFLNDTTVKICGGTTKDLTKIFPAGDDYIYNWSAPSPSLAPAGNYTLTAEDNIGCQYNVAVKVLAPAATTTLLNLCIYQQSSNSAFTTNLFRSVVVDRAGTVWAGADAGGLYRFTSAGAGCTGTWTKSPNFPTNTYKDLAASVITGDNSIWAASTGNSGANAISGGVYHILNNAFATVRYGSTDDVGGGTLSSRFANSLTMSNNGMLYVALGQSLTDNNINEGGVFEYNLVTQPASFTQTELNVPITNTNVSAAGMRGSNAWFGVQRSCENGNCSNPYIVKWNAETNSAGGFVNENNSPLPFDAPSQPIVRAIFTDSQERTFVGFSAGMGIGVLEKELEDQTPVWIYLTSDNSPLPPGASVNFNAITEVNGEIWIGTTAGLLIYNGAGDLTDCASYQLYTTANGLPSNNVTDIAYDTARLEVWFTTNAGICKFKPSYSISGVVYNSYCGQAELLLLSNLQKKPLANVTVVLKDINNLKIDSIKTDATGAFNLTKALPNKKYKLEIKYLNKFSYSYADVTNNTLIGDVLIPDSLIKNIITYKSSIKSKEFSFKIPFEEQFSMVWKVPSIKKQGFDTTDYEKAYSSYNGIISNNHVKRVQNLAMYLNTLATVNKLGDYASNLADQASALAADFIVLLIELKSVLKELEDLNKLYQNLGNDASNELIDELNKLFLKGQVGVYKILKTKADEMFNASIRTGLTNDGKLTYDLIKGVVDQVSDQMILMVSNEEGIANLTADDLKKTLIKYGVNAVTKLLSAQYYTYYCQTRHKNFVPQLAASTKDFLSADNYANVYLKNYNPLEPAEGQEPSLLKQGSDLLDAANSNIETAKGVSGLAEVFSSITGAASQLALGFVVTAPLAPILKSISVGLQVLNVGSIGLATVASLNTTDNIANLSDNAVIRSGFPPILQSVQFQNSLFEQQSVSSLNLAKQQYIQSLRDFKTSLAGNFDTLKYIRTLNNLLLQDSIYGQEVSKTLNGLWPAYENSSNNIAGFPAYFNHVNNSFLTKQSAHRSALLLQNNFYLFDSNKVSQRPYLDSIINKLITLTDSSVAGLENIQGLLNNYKIESPAYLIQEKFDLQFNSQPGSSGKAIYTFKNIGNVPQQNVIFKISNISGGFQLTSSNQINAGTLQPQQSIQVSFNFQSPLTDTIGNYDVTITAGNGFVPKVSGALITKINEAKAVSVAKGLWSNAATWSNGRVPKAITDVTVYHNVTVDINAECKSIRSYMPGLIKVNTGKTLTIKK